MREFGSGVFNGSLWTIAVELQFYILVPILYSITSLTARNRTQGNVIVVTVILFFLVANRVIDGVASRNWEWLDSLALTLGAGGRTDLGLKLLNVSFLPWFYMFLVGVLVQRNFAWTLTLVRGKGMHLFVLYIAIAVCGREMFDINTGNRIEPLLFLILVACVFACAYTMPYLSNKILKRNDVSYGVYIYHMPVINIALYLGCERRGDCLLYVLLTTLMLATLSWTFIERPILRLKKHPLKVPK
jgi:peptidoglycan/LPS O-acetylase OafA/YrhL